MISDVLVLHSGLHVVIETGGHGGLKGSIVFELDPKSDAVAIEPVASRGLLSWLARSRV